MNLRLRLVLLVLYYHALIPSRFLWNASLQPCKHYDGFEDTSAESPNRLLKNNNVIAMTLAQASGALAITRVHHRPSDFILDSLLATRTKTLKVVHPMAAVAPARFVSYK
jgi:hypothetical protein